MTLLEYLRQSRAVEQESVLAEQAKKMAGEIMQENIDSGGSRYPTADSMWKELLRRAEALEHDKSSSGNSTADRQGPTE